MTITSRLFCPCCHGYTWFGCHCDETCDVGRRRIAEGRDETDVEGDPPDFAAEIEKAKERSLGSGEGKP